MLAAGSSENSLAIVPASSSGAGPADAPTPSSCAPVAPRVRGRPGSPTRSTRLSASTCGSSTPPSSSPRRAMQRATTDAPLGFKHQHHPVGRLEHSHIIVQGFRHERVAAAAGVRRPPRDAPRWPSLARTADRSPSFCSELQIYSVHGAPFRCSASGDWQPPAGRCDVVHNARRDRLVDGEGGASEVLRSPSTARAAACLARLHARPPLHPFSGHHLLLDCRRRLTESRAAPGRH